MEEHYTTIKEYAKDCFIERRSEFIGYITPVKTEDEAIEFINKIREKHRKATHNCYAYILRDNNTVRYSDDGEPQGTAAVPMLDVLQKEGLTDVCLVVTRYFGGILLGGGGLVRAYSHSAKIAVDASTKLNMYKCVRLKVNSDYSLYGKISYALSDFRLKQTASDFSDTVSLELILEKSQVENFRKKLVEITCGKVEIVEIEELFADL